MAELTCGAIREAMLFLPDNTPALIMDPDGVPWGVALIHIFERCDGSKALHIQLEDEDEDTDLEEEEDEALEEDMREDSEEVEDPDPYEGGDPFTDPEEELDVRILPPKE